MEKNEIERNIKAIQVAVDDSNANMVLSNTFFMTYLKENEPAICKNPVLMNCIENICWFDVLQV